MIKSYVGMQLAAFRAASLLAVATVLPFSSTLAAAEANEAMAARPGDFTLYVGLDIATDLQGKRYPVVAGSDTEIRVRKDGETVRMQRKDAQLRAAMEPRLSRGRASIEGLSGDRAYSASAEPSREAISQQMLLESIQAHTQEVNELEANAAARRFKAVEADAANPASSVSKDQVEEAAQASFAATNRLISSYVTTNYQFSTPNGVGDGGTFDAFAVSFRISTPEARAGAYGVLRVLVRDPANSQQVVQVLKFFDLRELGPKPRKVTITQTGLPAGFSVDSYDVHVYVAGEEIPSNLSRNRVDVSADEAHQFLILQHLQLNGEASKPAEAIPALQPAGLRALIGPQQMSVSIDLAINQEGRVSGIFASGGNPMTLDAKLVAELRQVRFLPALLKGKPLDSRGTFALGELVK